MSHTSAASRRRFLAHTGGLASGLLLLRSQSMAASQSAPRLLLVFLRGGLDTASVLVPVASDFDYRVRPDIAIARPGSRPDAALPLDGTWGLHPALGDTLLPLYQRRELAFVAFAGTDDVSRSHFETQDSMELGQQLSGTRDFSSGFLNRLAAILGGAVNPIAFTEQLPLIMRGPQQIGNVALSSVGKTAIDPRQRDRDGGLGARQRCPLADRGDRRLPHAAGADRDRAGAARRDTLSTAGAAGRAEGDCVGRLMRIVLGAPVVAAPPPAAARSSASAASSGMRDV